MDSISVIIPTLNSRQLLEPVIAGLREALRPVGEIIVVDSFSEDGTLDLLRRELDFPQTRFIQHPPGLYASWNHGVTLATREFCYFSTAGDAITGDELARLLFHAEKSGADVIVAPPLFVGLTGNPVTGIRWPIHDLLERVPEGDSVELSGASLAALSLAHTDPIRGVYHSWLGSSASNLYLTSTLKARPFPEDAGNGGDALFGMENAMTLKAVFARQPCGRFVIHDQLAPPSREKALANEARLERGYLDTHQRLMCALAEGPPPQPALVAGLLARHQDSLLNEARSLRQSLELEHEKVMKEIEKKSAIRAKLETIQSLLQATKDTNKQQKVRLEKAAARIPAWLRRILRLELM